MYPNFSTKMKRAAKMYEDTEEMVSNKNPTRMFFLFRQSVLYYASSLELFVFSCHEKKTRALVSKYTIPSVDVDESWLADWSIDDGKYVVHFYLISNVMKIKWSIKSYKNLYSSYAMHSGLLRIAVYVIHTTRTLTHAWTPIQHTGNIAKVYLWTDSFSWAFFCCSHWQMQQMWSENGEWKKWREHQQQCQYNNNSNNNHDDENEEKTA